MTKTRTFVVCPQCGCEMHFRTWHRREDTTGGVSGWECTNLVCLYRVLPPWQVQIRRRAA
jgi:ssDNA-binding Zn-finger/Zn-ribbon topoisomerase 1